MAQLMVMQVTAEIQSMVDTLAALQFTTIAILDMKDLVPGNLIASVVELGLVSLQHAAEVRKGSVTSVILPD